MIQKFSFIYKSTAVFLLLAMFSPLFTASANAQQMAAKAKAKPLTENQKILHVA